MSQVYQRHLSPDATRLVQPDLPIGGFNVSPAVARRIVIAFIVAGLLWGAVRVVSVVRAGLASHSAQATAGQVAGYMPAGMVMATPTAAIPLGVAGARPVAPLQAAVPAAASLQVAGAVSALPAQMPVMVGPATALASLQVVSPTLDVAAQAAMAPVVAPAPLITTSVATTVALSSQSALDQAWKAKNWPEVIALAEPMLKATPKSTTLKDKLFSAHFNYAVQLVRSDKLAEAVAEFDKALAIKPANAQALGERKYAQLYLDGSTALAKSDFAAAITPLRTIYLGNTNYRSVKTRLYQAYVGYAAKLEKSGKRDEACTDYQKASTIDTQGAEAKAGVARCQGSTTAPAATQAATGKKIEVSIAKQQVTVWESGKVKWQFTVSTGEKPWLTRTGTFKILDKMPNAYSSGLKWGMPYWMGIYYAGAEENGFHALARVNGGVMPDSVLGKPKTHGCIMLSDSDAHKLYDWTDVGTVVTIH